MELEEKVTLTEEIEEEPHIELRIEKRKERSTYKKT
jgi:hypothetical protein